MSHLAAVLSHDMRVPLSSIIACLEMLEEELGANPDPAVTALLDRATKAADRMLRMLDQNLTIDPVPRSQSRMDVDLDTVANQLAIDSAPLLERAGATLKVGRLPVVRARPDEMYSVLQNLLTNAVKFTRPGVRPWVSISARQIPYGWRVSVTDNGIGIPAQRRMDVFTLFSRANSGVEGYGIGLSTVARIVHNLGGRVGADEAPSGGAEVWFELPASSDA
jgi:signal transduction histidine kinase